MLFKNSLHPWCFAAWVCNNTQCTMQQFRRQPFLIRCICVYKYVGNYRREMEKANSKKQRAFQAIRAEISIEISPGVSILNETRRSLLIVQAFCNRTENEDR